MKITALNQAIKDKERVNVFVDDDFLIAVDKKTLVQEKLFIGKEVDKQFIEKLKDLDTYNLITRKIINWVFIRPRSSSEIHTKIQTILNNRKSKSISLTVDLNSLNLYVTTQLNQLGFTDESFATWWIHHRQNQSKYGAQRILGELISKGVNSSLAKQLISNNFTNEHESAVKLLSKKFGVSSVKEIKDQKLKAKAYRFLISRGFKVF